MDVPESKLDRYIRLGYKKVESKPVVKPADKKPEKVKKGGE